MKNYSANPGYVVTIIRKTQDYIERERISMPTIRKINDLLKKINSECVKNIDKTMTGFVLYELVLYATKFYEAYAREVLNKNIFSKENCEVKAQDLRITEKSIGILQSDNFGIVLNPGPKHKSSHSTDFNPPITKSTVKASILAKNMSLTQKKINAKPVPAKKPENNKKVLQKPAFVPVKNFVYESQPLLGKKQVFQKSVSPVKKHFFSITKQKKSQVNSIDLAGFSKKKLESSRNSVSSASFSPDKTRNSVDVHFANDIIDHRDLLEEMQYQQFIEEKFRHFLVDKLNHLNENSTDKVTSETNAMKNREAWMKEFEQNVGIIRFSCIGKLKDEKRFTAELIRAQRQLEILEKFNAELT